MTTANSNSGTVSTLTIKASQIIADQNMRTEDSDALSPESIERLAASIKTNGLIQPIAVTRVTDDEGRVGLCFRVVDGHRRFAACQLLGMTDIPVHFVDFKDVGKQALATAVANLSRVGVTSWELAMWCQKLRDGHGMKVATISKNLVEQGIEKGTSVSNVNNLLKCLDTLHPTILKDWKDGHKVATTFNLFTVKGEADHPAQLALWEALKNPGNDRTVGGVSANGEGGTGDTDPVVPPVKKRKTRTVAQVEAQIEMLKALVVSPEEMARVQGMIDALGWVLRSDDADVA